MGRRSAAEVLAYGDRDARVGGRRGERVRSRWREQILVKKRHVGRRGHVPELHARIRVEHQHLGVGENVAQQCSDDAAAWMGCEGGG